MKDTCGCNVGGDCECLCTAVSAYAHACSEAGVHVSWRSLHLCRKYIIVQLCQPTRMRAARQESMSAGAHSTSAVSALTVNTVDET